MDLFRKSFGQYVIVMIIALIILIIYYMLFFSNNCGQYNMEAFINEKYEPAKWNRNKCDYVLGKTYENELKKFNIEHSNKDWNLYFPCGYDEIEKEMNAMPVVNDAKYFIIDNCDEMVAKEWLWKNMVSHYGINMTKTMLPNSFILYNNDDMKRFEKEYDQTKIYILKKNIQRQEGLKITKSKTEVLAGKSQGYVLAQELLQDPYLISGRKTNMRFYVLVLCKGGEINVYVHMNGFMYYTKDMFKPNSTEDGSNITTGYIDRQVYVDNPLTHDDLRTYLDRHGRNLLEIEKNIKGQGLKIGEVYFNRIYHLLRSIFIVFVGKICKLKKFNNNVMFQLFGVDIAVNDQLNPMIMEINKGPDMGAKDKRDSELKQGVVRDMFKIIGSIQQTGDSKFVRILDVKNGIINKTDL